jgi:hypothetical protein
MIKRIIIALIIFLALVFVISFFAAGGAREISQKKETYTNPLAFLYDENAISPFSKLFSSDESDTDSDSSTLSDSFQSENNSSSFLEFPSIDLSTYLGSATIISSDGNERSFRSIQEDLINAEEDYDKLQKQIEEAKVFGTPSPLKDKVRISKFFNGTRESNTKLEYITLSANNLNTAPINITGWSIQSALTGVRVYIPTGVRTFKMGRLGSISDIYVDPAREVVVTTGVSPIGDSFRENICTGYLEQFQNFEPELKKSCPLPSSELPDTLENLKRYGNTCFDFINSLNQCEYFLESFPNDISDECQSFVKNALTYNGCVERHQWRPSFSTGDWRVFLNRRYELWQNNRDVIRLLDKEGRTVDVWSY